MSEEYERALEAFIPAWNEYHSVIAAGEVLFGKPHHGSSKEVRRARARYSKAKDAYAAGLARIASDFDVTREKVVADMQALELSPTRC